MRKLLLGSTALAAPLFSNVALQMSQFQVYEFTYKSQDPGTTVAGASTTFFLQITTKHWNLKIKLTQVHNFHVSKLETASNGGSAQVQTKLTWA